MTEVKRDPARVQGPSPARMIRRGLLKRCAVCGSPGLFEGRFKMRERCPRCGYVFAREDGFALGASLMNLAVTEALLACIGIIPLIAMLAANPDADVLPVIVASLVAAVAGPVVFYPFSRTLWVALEVAFRPAAAREPGDRP